MADENKTETREVDEFDIFAPENNPFRDESEEEDEEMEEAETDEDSEDSESDEGSGETEEDLEEDSEGEEDAGEPDYRALYEELKKRVESTDSGTEEEESDDGIILNEEDPGFDVDAKTREIVSALGDEDAISEALNDPESYIKLLTKVVRDTLSAAQDAATSKALRQLPNAVQKFHSQQTTLKTKVETFFEKNADLTPHRQVVGKVVQRIVADNPGTTLTKALTQAGEEVRGLLTALKGEIPGGAPTTEKRKKPSKRSGVLKTSKSRRNASVKPSRLQSQLDELTRDLM